MPDWPQHLDHLFEEWPYEFGDVAARKVQGRDGRDVLQLRMDMGVLQLEVTGRPDGGRPGGCDNYMEYLQQLVAAEGEEFELDDTRCIEIDREFVQYYHRRIAWLSLGDFDRAAADADHSLALMDFSSLHAPHAEWAEMHEQYRPFVLFHRTQAVALAALELLDPTSAVEEIEEGCKLIENSYRLQGAEEEDLAEDEFLVRLGEMKTSLEEQYEIEPPLAKQLAEAIAREQYELAAELRDRIARHGARR
ncbi:UvrB/UvrC motif-containing protein [Aeoliella sp. ICT_H6.2]|uniref:UvrB/UvrC motif-containing protein n=1 Tax=Aeoliella straminimaris TaxID=2954799 RepID=A0A9X2JH45_9BACT|nr:UvrB/UvrC motif-containing protein [Aeoliella straminimaris]MCO6045416.1 UvrB/UvrC motif-containing protein [Aeoliella straminimaris]